MITYRNLRSIKSFSDSEVRIRLYYFYRLISALRTEQFDDEVINLFFEFAVRLNKKVRLSNVVSALVVRFMDMDKLHPVREEDEEKAWKFSSRSKLAFHFYEDEDAGDKFSFCKVEGNSMADFIRCAFVGGKNLMLRIFEQTFFSDSDSVNIRHVAVPSSLKKEVSALSLAGFLSEYKIFTKSQIFYLQTMYRYITTKEFSDTFFSTFRDPIEIMQILGVSAEQIENVIENSQIGVLGSFLDDEQDLTATAAHCIRSQSLQPFFNDMSRKMPLNNTFHLDTFPVKEEKTEIAKSLLLGSDSANILLYGAAGSGKTEFAKSLAKECGLKAIRFKNSYEVESSCDSALSSLNLMLSINREDTVFIVDEAESLLETKPVEGFFGTISRKGTVNKLFENCRNKVIWIVNYTDRMDESTKRRFTYSIQFEKLNEKNLEKISRNRLSSLHCSKNLKKRLLDLCGKYEVTGSSVSNMMSVMKALDGSDEAKIEDTVKNVLESNAVLLNGDAKMRGKTKKEYDMSVLNSSVPAEQIVEMVENATSYVEENPCGETGIRMLFYGLSGTGKTELARYIAEKLGKKILLKRASDIISKFIGESEKNISAAFAEAERTGQILLFDEADSFFRDRSLAHNEWEITQTNEFLTQMEEFKGILICTTNLRSIMDKATLRRFHICAEFKALNKDGIKRLLEKYFSKVSFTEKQVDSLARYKSVTPGDFGALSGRIRFMKPESVTSDYIVSGLINLQEEKGESSARAIGFCA